MRRRLATALAAILATMVLTAATAAAAEPAGPVSVLVNQVGTGGGDQLSTYVGE